MTVLPIWVPTGPTGTDSYSQALKDMYAYIVEMAVYAGEQGFSLTVNPTGWDTADLILERDEDAVSLRLAFPDLCTRQG